MSGGHALIRVRVGDRVKSLATLSASERRVVLQTFRTNTVPVIQVPG